jgi:putative transposase
MKDTARGRRRSQETTTQLTFAAMLDARATLHDVVMRSGMAIVAAMLEDDRELFCGQRYVHDRSRAATRAGYADGELALGGRRVTIRRPRVRNARGEVALPTWEHFASADPLTPRAMEQMILGVSTRNYARSIEAAPTGFATRGASKSAVSRRFVAATQEKVIEMTSRDLSGISLCAVLIDGIHIGEHLIVIALGVDESGDKHVLGLHEGATENESVCAALISDLASRGMRTDRAMLFVIDGSKALVAAIRKAFGKRALIQRCQVHKRRNVEDHLPEAMKQQVGRTMSTAYRCRDAERARHMLKGLARMLERKHPSAAASLREGLDETLTVMRMALPDYLERTLSTTNPIEFVNGRIRATTHNVKKWNGGAMAMRSVTAALLEASKTFRKLRGYKGMPILIAALRAHDQLIKPASVDASKKAA